MNEQLQTILNLLNSSQTVSFQSFIQALEKEPDIILTDIFTGVSVTGSTIDWKNLPDDFLYLQEIFLFKPDNTANWKFSFLGYNFTDIDIYMKVESTSASSSDISIIVTAQLNHNNTVLPVLISKYGARIDIYSYMNNGDTVYFEFDKIEKFLDTPLLKQEYPVQIQGDSGLQCSLLHWSYDLLIESLTDATIVSHAPDWAIGDSLYINLTNCKIICDIFYPYDNKNMSFTIEGDYYLNSQIIHKVHIKLPTKENPKISASMNNGHIPVTSISNMIYLFNNINVISMLPETIKSISDLLLDSFNYIYDTDNSDILSFHVGFISADNATWSIIPDVLILEKINLDFYYSPLFSNISGILSLDHSNLKFTTSLIFDSESLLQSLILKLDNNTVEGIPIILSDFAKIGFSITDSMPFLSSMGFRLNDLALNIEISPQLLIRNFDICVSTLEKWQILPSLSIEDLTFDLKFNNNGIYLDSSSICGSIKVNDNDINIVISIPETGDWTLTILNEINDVIFDDVTVITTHKEGRIIPLPSISDICELIGIGDFADKLPSSFLLDGIELTDLLITFPKPTEEAAIHTAAFELKTTSEWEFLPGIFSMKNIKLKSNIDFTGEETDFTFTLSGTVEIAGIDLNAMVSKNADGDWVFEIDLDIDPADKPSVKEMISSLIHMNLPGIFPDIDIDELKVSGNISDEYYRFDMKLSDFWDLEEALGLELDLQELSITGISDKGTTSGSVSGLLEVGDAKLNLSASLAPSGGGAESHLEFSGGLADGSDLQIGDLLSAFGFPSPDILNNDTFEIDKLSFYFNTADGKAGFDIGCSLNINLFGFEDIELRGGIELHRENSGADWVGKLTGDLYLFSMRLSAAYPIDNATEDNIDLRLYLPKAGDPDSDESIHCQVIKKPDNSKIFRLNFEGFTVHELFEQLANLIIPGTELDFPWPWNKLTGVQIPDNIYLDIVLTPGGDTKINAAVAIPTGLINRIPGVDLNQMLLIFDFEDLAIDVEMTGELFTKSFDNISFDLISEDPPTPVFKNGLLDLKYAGLGRHVRLVNVPDVARMNELITQLRTAFQEKPNSAGDGIFNTLRYSSSSEWLIGFDLILADFIRLAVIFNDPILYGMLIKLDGPAAKQFSGFEFEILYQRLAAGIGAYRTRLELPPALRTIELGAMSLTLPFVGIDIYTNGDFKLDLGFPYRRNFYRSFALSLFPFYGKGGFYFGKLNGATSTSVPKIINGKFAPVIEFGVGLQVGLGKEMNAGIMRAALTVGIYAILEGVFAIFKPYAGNGKEEYFWRVQGVIGVAATLEGVIKFRLIKAGFSVKIYQEAYISAQCFEPIKIGGRMGVSVKARVKVSRWVKITFRFHKTVNVSFTIGKRKKTPWIIDTSSASRSYSVARVNENMLVRSMSLSRSSMLMAPAGTFDWNIYTPAAKSDLTWYANPGFTVLLDGTSGGNMKAAAVPMLCAEEEQFKTWIENIFRWLTEAWLGENASVITYKEAEEMESTLDTAAELITWGDISSFIGKTFNITLAEQPEPENPDNTGFEFKSVIVPLPPALKVALTVDNTLVKEVDLSVHNIESALLDTMENLSKWHVRGAEMSEPGTSYLEPMSELLWKDITGLQLKELAARLMNIMKGYKFTISTDAPEYSSIADLYDALCFDPDPTDADIRPFFEDFVTANISTTGLFVTGSAINNPDGDDTVVELTDTIESIAERCNVLPVELMEANLDTNIIAPGSTWVIPALKSIELSKAWSSLNSAETNAVADISAMTSRFLLHGQRFPDSENSTPSADDESMGLYEKGELQFDVNYTKTIDENGNPVFAFPDMKFTLSRSPEQAAWLHFPDEQNEILDITVSGDEKEFLSGLLTDISFEPMAEITGMDVVKEKPVQFTLARTIPLKRYSPGDTVTTDGQLRSLTPEFFQYLGIPGNENVSWDAKIVRRSAVAGENNTETIDIPSWMLRIDIDISKIEDKEVETASKGRKIYRINELSSANKFRIANILEDMNAGKINVTIVPATGVAGATTSTGGITAGVPGSADIVIFRNDADIDTTTPARSANNNTKEFLQILSECGAEQTGTFFFADIFKARGDIDTITAEIFPDGGENGVITLLLNFTGEVDPRKHADSLWLDAAHDPGSSVVTLEAEGRKEKIAVVSPDNILFRIERPEAGDDSTLDDELESLYSLLSFSLSNEDGSNASPHSIAIGPNIDEENSKWFYEQIIPFETAYNERQNYTPYDSVGKTRYLNIEWRDIYGNAVTRPFKGKAVPGAGMAENLTKLPLKSYYWDDIVPLSQWPGVKISHWFEKENGIPSVSAMFKVDPSALQSAVSQSGTEIVKTQLKKIKDQVTDARGGSGMKVEIETSVESDPQGVSDSVNMLRKAALSGLLDNIGYLLDESEKLSYLNLEPQSTVTIGEFMTANRLTSREFADIARDIPVNELIAPDATGNIPELSIPVKWQTGASDNIDSIASELLISADELISNLAANTAFMNNTTVLAEGVYNSIDIVKGASVNFLCSIYNTTPAAMLNTLKAEAVFTENMVIDICNKPVAADYDETIGELLVRIDESYNVAASAGFAVKPEPEDVISVNTGLVLNTGVDMISDERLAVYIDQENPLNMDFWRVTDSVKTPADVSADFDMSDIVHLNRFRADIINPGVVITFEADSETKSVTTLATDTFETLKSAIAAETGKELSLGGFISIISASPVIKAGAYILIPPQRIKFTQPAALKNTPEAFELDTYLILKRFNEEPGADIELIHPDLRDKKSVWYQKVSVPAASSASESESPDDEEVTGLQPYARLFKETFSDTAGSFSMFAAIGSSKEPGADGDSSAIYAVRLGNGGYSYNKIPDVKPAFISLRPISTVPVNRGKVKILGFTPDTVNITAFMETEDGRKNYTEQDFSNIDPDMWGKRTLDTLDRLLKPASALSLSDITATASGNRYDDLLSTRAELSDMLTKGLTEIIDYPDADAPGSPETVRIMKELIGNRLAAAYDIDTIAMFPLSTSGRYKATGSFIDRTEHTPCTDMGWKLKPTWFSSDDSWLIMPVDVLKPEEHKYIEPDAFFQLETMEIESINGPVILSFIIMPGEMSLDRPKIPVPLRDIPEAPQITKQFGAPDFEIDSNGEPDLDEFRDLLDWRYEIDYLAKFAEQDTHTLDIFYNLGSDAVLPAMRSMAREVHIFESLFHVLAQCDATLEKYADILESRIKEGITDANTQLGWILDDVITLQGELAYWWGVHFGVNSASLRTMKAQLQASRHTYVFYEEIPENDDFTLLFVFKCKKDDPKPMVRVADVASSDANTTDIYDEASEVRTVTVTFNNFFNDVRPHEILDRLPRTIGFKDLNILEKQNSRCRMQIVRNAELIAGEQTAEAFIYRTPVVTLRDRFFPCVEMGKRVRLSAITGKNSYTGSAEILSDIINGLLTLKDAAGNTITGPVQRRVALSVRYGFALNSNWSEPDSFACETPLFYLPHTVVSVPYQAGDDSVAELAREMDEWLVTSGVNRSNAGFVIGVDIYTDETLNPNLVIPGNSLGIEDDAMLLRIINLEVDFPVI